MPAAGTDSELRQSSESRLYLHFQSWDWGNDDEKSTIRDTHLVGDVGAGQLGGCGSGKQRWGDHDQWGEKRDLDEGSIAAFYTGRAAIIEPGQDLQHFGKR